ncbi:hypothetical protein ACFQKG_28875 [Streptomyces caelestis]|uniref:Uncharacterized protein n=1 Tax=Streptomyces caelestis TaxID=36816 RepID=A0A7W9GYT7_9ACTN|nr:hypothetical protein [Streptomyces caelestis]
MTGARPVGGEQEDAAAARRRTLRALTVAAAASLPSASTAWSRPVPPQPEARAPAAAGPATRWAPAGELRGADGERAVVSLCAGSGTPVMAVSAPATCHRPGTSVRYACLTSDTWTARREGATVASGTLPGSQPSPGPGTYGVTATVHVRSAPAGVDPVGGSG